MIDYKKLSLRDAELNDLAEIVDIYNSTISSRMVTADLNPVSIESKINWFNEHNSDFRPFWVAQYENNICAWVSFQSFHERPAYKYTVELSIYIEKSFRNKGLGNYLLDYAIKECPRLKIKTLIGLIFAHNEPSLKLFLKHGFEEWGHFPKIAELDKAERDLCILGRRI